MYNNKPFRYIIMVIEELKWFIEEKEWLNDDTGKVKNEIHMQDLHQQIQ